MSVSTNIPISNMQLKKPLGIRKLWLTENTKKQIMTRDELLERFDELTEDMGDWKKLAPPEVKQKAPPARVRYR
jgi:hypothetical protein